MQTVTVKEAARLLGIHEQCLREMLKADKAPFGVALNYTGKKWTYKIFKPLLEKFIRGEIAYANSTSLA